MTPTAQTRRTAALRGSPPARRPRLFRSVPDRDYLRLFDRGRPRGRKVVAILGYSKSDVADAAGVPASSVRYDAKMPSDLRDRLIEWATAINLVAGFFGGLEKTVLWFQVPNPLLGGWTPSDMIKLGRTRKLLGFIQTSLDENRR